MTRGVCNDPEREKQRAAKISKARKARKKRLGFINSAETKKKIGDAQRGRKLSKKHRQNIADALKGKTPKNFEAMLAKAHATPKPKGPEHADWKGDEVSYSGLHQWVRRELGIPRKCQQCGTEESKQYEWANISGEYKRDLTDWIRLCTLCHRRMDRAKLVAAGWAAWNKGKKGRTNTGRTHFKKGVQNNPTGGFQKGHKTHNKYLEPKPCEMCGKEFQPRETSRKYCCRKCYWESMKKT